MSLDIAAEMNVDAVEGFFNYARRRYQMMLDKDGGMDKPWTEDVILQRYRFCNVFREHDVTTKWFRENIRDPLKSERSVLFATVMFRWFNKMETGQALLNHGGLEMFTKYNPKEIRAAVKGLKPLINGAYMIKTPAGSNKLEGIIWILDRFAPAAEFHSELLSQKGYTLEDATLALAQFPYFGPFMSYEVVTDLRHTDLLRNAPDINTWANPGPGAARGCARILAKDPKFLNRFSAVDVKYMMEIMQQLLKFSQSEDYWPKRWPKWEMREVEHTLCEFDKYERARCLQGAPKQLYAGV